MKLLTVVVPVYNTASWLRRCLDSVLVETLRGELELIAVDDGSTDGSSAILREYEAQWPGTMRVIRKENGGHGSAVNTGLAAANGLWFRVLDSDDWFDTPGFLRLMRRLPACREDLIVTPYSREHMDSGLSEAVDYPFLRPETRFTFESLDWHEGMDYFCLASSTWRTDLLRRCGLRLLEHCSYVDMQLALCPVPLIRDFRLIPGPVYRYAIGRSGQSVAPEQMRVQAPMHQRVLSWLAGFYAAQRGSLNPGKARYMRLVLYYMLHTHTQLLLYRVKDRRTARCALRELDDQLRREAPELYDLAGRLPALHLSRRLSYLDLLLPTRAAALLSSCCRSLHSGRKAAV